MGTVPTCWALWLIDKYAWEYGNNKAPTGEHNQMCEDAIRPVGESLDNKQFIGEVCSISLEHTDVMLDAKAMWSRLESEEIVVPP